MQISTTITAVDRNGDDGVLITFSDGTTAGYVVEELLELRPKRELRQKTKSPVRGSPRCEDGEKHAL